MNNTTPELYFQAAIDLIEIDDAGLLGDFLNDLESLQQSRYQPHRTKGCLSRIHGDRWNAEYRGLSKREEQQRRVLGCNLASLLGESPADGMGYVWACQDEPTWQAIRLLRRWATIARFKLVGVAIDLPQLDESSSSELESVTSSPRQSGQEVTAIAVKNTPDLQRQNRKSFSEIEPANVSKNFDNSLAKPAPVAPALPMPVVTIMGATR